MLTMSACWSTAAHSMPASTQESWPEPSSESTLPMCRSAPGATPFSLPSDAAPVPAMVDAT